MSLPRADASTPNPPDLTSLDVSGILKQYRARTLSPVAVTQAILKRIEQLQPRFNAYRFVDAEGALAAAQASEGRWQQGRNLGPLDGIPVAFKDLLHVRGWPTRKGSLATSAKCQPEDSPVAARLRQTGAVLLGKTQTAEFGWRGLTETQLAGITRNAWNSDYASSGSSGGAAVAAALGLGPVHIGTDGGGSIRAPAAVNGVFGFKPSHGRVAGHPSALNGNLFHIGPITRSVIDAARVLNVIAAPDVRDWTSLPDEGRDWLDGLNDVELNLKGVRIAYARTLFRTPIDPGIAAIIDRAVARLTEQGAQVTPIDPGFDDPTPILNVLAAERAERLLREIGEKGLEQVDPEIRASVARARRYNVADLVEAQDKRAALAVQLRRFHQSFHVLVTPVQPQPVTRVGTTPPTLFLGAFNLTQQPAASVPAGLDARGLPVGLQIVGPPLGDAIVLKVARAFELAQPFPRVPRDLPGSA
jgi:aspartyl-tRNA(Asn)/glutamyl-tRNA(Gln) amidotransferase subunit A